MNERSILTRSARIKAGLPSPPSLYPKSKRVTNTEQQCSSKTINSPAITPSDDENGDNQIFIWVQCDSCHKWRKIKSIYEKNLKNNWYCSDNLDDPYHQSCDHPEEDWEFPSSGWIYTYEGFVVGQLVWGKMDTYPPWPGIISRDPWCSDTFVSFEEDLGGSLYHVEFLGKVRSHCWLPQEMVEPYRSDICSLGSKCYPKVDWRHNKQLQHAICQADSMLELSNEERVIQCEYTATKKKKLEKGKSKDNKHKKIKVESKASSPLVVACSSNNVSNTSLNKASSLVNCPEQKELEKEKNTLQRPDVTKFSSSMLEYLKLSIIQSLLQENDQLLKLNQAQSSKAPSLTSKGTKVSLLKYDRTSHRRRSPSEARNKKGNSITSEKNSQTILQYFEPLQTEKAQVQDKCDQVVPDIDNLNNLEQEAQHALVDIEKMLLCFDSSDNMDKINIEEVQDEMTQIEELLDSLS